VISISNSNDGVVVGVILVNVYGSFLPAVSCAAGAELRSLVVGDMNGDTKPDLVVGGNKLAVLLNQPQLFSLLLPQAFLPIARG
jgi:hypothetical protein